MGPGRELLAMQVKEASDQHKQNDRDDRAQQFFLKEYGDVVRRDFHYGDIDDLVVVHKDRDGAGAAIGSVVPMLQDWVNWREHGLRARSAIDNHFAGLSTGLRSSGQHECCR